MNPEPEQPPDTLDAIPDPIASSERTPDRSLSPYDILTGIEPNTNRKQVLSYLQVLQRQKDFRSCREAINALKKPPRRAAWDLFEPGTTPEVEQSTWEFITGRSGSTFSFAELEVNATSGEQPQHGGDAVASARLSWRSQIRRDGVDWNAVHVCALAALHQARRQASLAASKPVDEESEAGASDESLKACVAFWAALLDRRRWLLAFQRHRYRVWDWRQRDSSEADEFLKLVREITRQTILPLAGRSEARREWLQTLWNQEMAALAAQTRAGITDQWPYWTAGFGPQGLALLNEQHEVLKWLIRGSRGFVGGTPLTSLKAGDVRLTGRRPGESASAATAIHWLFSELGVAAAEVWHGRGHAASVELRKLRISLRGRSAQVENNSWFGTHEQSAALRERALDELSVEARIATFQEEITRPEVDVAEVCELAQDILNLADRHRNPWSVVCQLEAVLAARLRGCRDDTRQVLTPHVAAVMKAAWRIREDLLKRNAGQKIATPLALLFVDRAGQMCFKWVLDIPEKIQVNIRSDLMNAIDLAPLDPEVVEAFATLMQTLDFMVRDEHLSLLRLARAKIEACLRQGISSAALKALLQDLPT